MGLRFRLHYSVFENIDPHGAQEAISIWRVTRNTSFGSQLSVFCRLFAIPTNEYVDTFFQSLVQGTCFWRKPSLRDQSSMHLAPRVAFFVSILAFAYTEDLNNTGENKLPTIEYISEWRSRLIQWSSFAPSTISKRLAHGPRFFGLSLTSRFFSTILRPMF